MGKPIPQQTGLLSSDYSIKIVEGNLFGGLGWNCWVVYLGDLDYLDL